MAWAAAAERQSAAPAPPDSQQERRPLPPDGSTLPEKPPGITEAQCCSVAFLHGFSTEAGQDEVTRERGRETAKAPAAVKTDDV